MDREYLVTGATGFLGRHLVERLVARGATVHIIVRARSQAKLERLLTRLAHGADRVVVHSGDLERPRLGLDAASIARLRGRVGHVFHLAALYDMSARAEDLERANVTGTANALELASVLHAGCFHHVSSIAAAGLFPGEFREDMFSEACALEHPYFRTKHEAEGLVRAERRVPWRIYRPGMIVGDSQTGEAERVDGPYHLFKPLQLMGRLLPRWLPTVGVEGGVWNIVPVDYVADALDHIAHREGRDGECFHLTDPNPMTVGDVVHTFARAADAGRGTVRISNAVLRAAVGLLIRPLMSLPPIARATDRALARIGLDRSLLRFLGYPTRFDSRAARAALAGSGIRVPPLAAYAPALWRYWAVHLDPDRGHCATLEHALSDKVVVVTGASSGIGRAVSLALARTGATLVLVGRNLDRLRETQEGVRALGAEAFAYGCDLSDMAACDALVERVRDGHGGADVLINSAGRSIRRSIERSYERFHDFERTMQLNYFGALRLTLGLLPGMAKRGGGQVINISSIAVQAQTPRFSAYVASKAALDAFSRSAAGEFAAQGVKFTTVNMPLVRTPMVAPTRLYRYVPMLTAEQAARLVTRAIVERPERVATPLGLLAELGYLVAPRTFRALMGTSFRLFDDSTAARRSSLAPREQTGAARALQQSGRAP